MSRDRFEKIKGIFHVAYNRELLSKDRSEYDKLFKIRQLYDHVQANCQAIPSAEVNSIDEQIVPYKGQVSSMRQYNPEKPTPWGYKFISRGALFTGLLMIFCIHAQKHG
jgi:hypothetical protein